MDSSKNLSGTEGCSSSESGWTMYIASPEKECNDDNDDGVSLGQEEYKKDEGEEEEGDSDDSMASDASSGPCDRVNLYGFRHAEKKKEEKKKQIMKGEKEKKAKSGGKLKKF